MLTHRSFTSLRLPRASPTISWYAYLVRRGYSCGAQIGDFQSLRFASNGWGPATLLGSGSFPKWYFWQGNLVVVDPNGGSYPLRPLINSGLTATGCSKSGALSFVLGGSSNKCAKYGNFQIQSFVENAQLGAKLVVDYTGGFYACGSNWDVSAFQECYSVGGGLRLTDSSFRFITRLPRAMVPITVRRLTCTRFPLCDFSVVIR